MRPGGLWGCLLLPPHTPTGLVTPVPVWHCWESWHGVGIRLGRESGHMECCAGLERDIFVGCFLGVLRVLFDFPVSVVSMCESPVTAQPPCPPPHFRAAHSECPVLLQLLVLSCLARLHSALWTETLRLQVCDAPGLSCGTWNLLAAACGGYCPTQLQGLTGPGVNGPRDRKSVV